jgi:hypothetical protein
VKEAGRAIEEEVFDLSVEEGDHEFGGLFGAIFEIGTAEAAGGGRFGLALGKLQGEAGEFEGVGVGGGGGDQVHAEEFLAEAPEALSVFEKARAFGVVRVNGGEGGVEEAEGFWI